MRARHRRLTPPPPSPQVGWAEYHPFAPLLAAGAGHRRLADPDDDAGGGGGGGALRVWRFGG